MSIVVKWRRAAIAALAASCALCADADDWREMMWEAPVALRGGVTIRAYALDK